MVKKALDTSVKVASCSLVTRTLKPLPLRLGTVTCCEPVPLPTGTPLARFCNREPFCRRSMLTVDPANPIEPHEIVGCIPGRHSSPPFGDVTTIEECWMEKSASLLSL